MPKTTVPPVLKVPKNKPAFVDDYEHMLCDHKTPARLGDGDQGNGRDPLTLDPLSPKGIEFDWEVLRRMMGEAKEDVTETDFALLADVLGELLRWIVKGDDLKIIGRRAVGLAWAVNPEIFNGASLRQLERKLGLCRGSRMSNDSADARRRLKVNNRSQKHGWNFKPADPAKN